MQSLVFPSTTQRIGIFFGVPIFHLHDSLHFEGRENLRAPIGSPVIFAANHLSELDGPLIAAAMPRRAPFFPLFFVGREQKFYDKESFGWRHYLYGGWFFRLSGVYPARDGHRSYAYSLAAHEELIRAGHSVAIFPEGRRRKTQNDTLPVHGGVAYLAEATGVPIVPVYVSGMHGVSLWKLLRGKVRIRIVFGAPIGPTSIFEGLSSDDPNRYRLAARTVMDEIEKLHPRKPLQETLNSPQDAIS